MRFKKGFTIIETLVAITILMISIVGPLTIAQKSLNASIYAKDQVIASFIAQEQMELIKFQRNTAMDSPVSSNNFNTFISSLPITCSFTLLYNQSDIPYVDSPTGIPTKFSICTSVESVLNNNDEVIITVKVKWDNGTISNETVLKNHIFSISI
jgi:type II secretory pathway pseudopilin PulG